MHGLLFVMSIFYWMHIAEGFLPEGKPMMHPAGDTKVDCSHWFGNDYFTRSRFLNRQSMESR